MNRQLRRRKRTASAIRLLCLVAAVFGFLMMFSMVLGIVVKGAGALSWHFLLSDASAGGIRNALLGHLLLAAAGTVFAALIGIGGGIYLSEYGRQSLPGRAITVFNEVAAVSMPPVVVGICIYTLVVRKSSFSGWAGVLGMVCLLLPFVMRPTGEALRAVPGYYREALYAVGAPGYRVSLMVLYRARYAVLYWVVAAVCWTSGDAALLLMTAGWAEELNFNLSAPAATLPAGIYAGIEAGGSFLQMAWGAAFLMLAAIVVLGTLTYLKPRRL